MGAGGLGGLKGKRPGLRGEELSAIDETVRLCNDNVCGLHMSLQNHQDLFTDYVICIYHPVPMPGAYT